MQSLSGDPASVTTEPAVIRATGVGEKRWRRLANNPSAAVGAIAVVLLILSALLAPLLAPYDPLAMAPRDAFQAPSQEHLMGTDETGRDLLSRILWGGRISLQVGLIVVAIGMVIGTLLGLISGFYGGVADMVIQRSIDVMLAIPGTLLALSIAASLGSGLRNVMIAVGFSTIPTYARLVRGCVLSVKEEAYVEAAWVVGVPVSRILRVHILPNVLSPILVLSSLQIGGAILSAAALSFLGLGAQPPTPEWGNMVSVGRDYIRDAWWLSTFPGLSIMFSVLAFNLLGDGLLEALDPRHN